MNWNVRHVDPLRTEDEWRGENDKRPQSKHLILSISQKFLMERLSVKRERVNSSYG